LTTIGTARVERGGLALRHFLDQAVELAGRGLVEPRCLLELEDTDRLKQAQRPNSIGICGVFRGLEAYRDMALRGEVVDFVRTGFLDDADQVGRIGHVSVMEDEALVGFVGILVNLLYPPRVERGGAAFHAVNFVALVQQQLSKICTILTRHPGDESDFASFRQNQFSKGQLGWRCRQIGAAMQNERGRHAVCSTAEAGIVYRLSQRRLTFG
jgi:hypothetical protein